MHRFGQFLVDPSAFLGWFDALGIAAVGIMFFTLFQLRKYFLLRLNPGLTAETFGLGVGVGGAISIVLTILITIASLLSFKLVMDLTDADLDRNRSRVAGIDQTRYQQDLRINRLQQAFVMAATNNKNNKEMAVVIVVCILLFVIGAGYAFTLLKLTFWGSFLAMSAGVGLPEELTKAATGLVLLYLLFDTKSLSRIQFRRTVLVAFGIAGLGFGAGESLKYFGAYASEQASLVFYTGRATWCVMLHGAWTLIVGAILANLLPQDAEALKAKKEDIFFMVLLACIPSAIAHGLYDACCLQESLLPWIVGGISLIAAMGTIEGFLEEQPQH
ncbi:MAG: PrsW family glutamic-type intramembrane protease [Thermogutta sp.]